MFADIMLPVIGMGVDVDLVENVGPVIADPVRTSAAVEQLRVPDPEEAVPSSSKPCGSSAPSSRRRRR